MKQSLIGVAAAVLLISLVPSRVGPADVAAERVVTSQIKLGDSPWRGRLRIADDERGFVDESGAWVLPLFAHFGEAFSAFVHGKTVDGLSVVEQLRRIKRAGYDGIRFWDHLGYYASAWRGAEVTPWPLTADSGARVQPTPRYYERLREFLMVLRDLGLAAHHSRGDLGGESPQIPLEAVVAHSTRVAEIYREVGLQTLALYEGNNEDFQNGNYGPHGLRRIVEPLDALGAITALSSSSEDPKDLRAYAADVWYVHGFREGDATERIKRIFSLGYQAPDAVGTRLGWQGEPIGPNDRPGRGVTIAHSADVEELGLLAAMSFIARQGWVYMSQCGVFWHCDISTHPGFTVVPRVRAALAEFAPDVMSWRLAHGGGDQAAWCVPEGCARGKYFGEPGVTRGPARVDQAIRPDGRKAVVMVYGGGGRRAVKNFMGCDATVTVVRPADDETLKVDAGVVVRDGEVFELPPYRVGRLLGAECR